MNLFSCILAFFRPTRTEIAYCKSDTENSLQSITEKSSREKGLCLCSKGIVKILPSISYFTNLESLQLCCNFLTEVPVELFTLKTLQSLSLAGNKLRKIPEEIGNLKMLKELYLSDNAIESLPVSMIKMQELRVLYVDGNRIKEIPQQFGYFANLTHLFASRNPIQYLPVELSRLTSLRKIDLGGCPLWCRGEETGCSRFELCNECHHGEEFPDDRMVKQKATSKILPLRDIAAIAYAKSAIASGKVWTEARQHKKLSPCNEEFIRNINECSTCHGPLFCSYYKRVRYVVKGEYLVPLVYKLCQDHWENEEERIRGMFQVNPTKSAIKQAYRLEN